MKKKIRSLFTLRLVYIATTLLLVALSLYVFKHVQALVNSSQQVNHSTEVTLELERILSTLLSAQSAHRGYLITHDSSFLDAFRNELKKYPLHITKARALTIDNPGQQKNITEVEHISKAREHHMTELLKVDRTRKPTKAEIMFGTSIMDSLNDRISGMIALENKLLSSRTRILESQKILTPILLLMISLGALSILLISYNTLNTELKKSLSLQKEQQLMVMEAPAIICMTRGHGHVVKMANEQCLKLFGHRNILDKPLRQALPELPVQGFYERLDEVFKTGQTHTSIEVPMKLNDGDSVREVYINFMYRASVNTRGETEGVLIYGSEVTEQVVARKKIEESEEQVRIAIEGGELGMFDYYPRTDRLLWSAKTREMFGLLPDDAVSYNTYINALHPEDREHLKALLNMVQHPENDGMYELEYRIYGVHDGKLKWIRFKGKATFGPDRMPVRFTGVTQDITQRKLAEKILQESEARFRSLADSAPALIWMSGTDKRCNYFNASWLAFTGRTIEEEKSKDGIQGIHPDDFQRYQSVYTTAFDKREEFYVEFRLRRHDGMYRWISDKGCPRLVEGEFHGYIGACMDIHNQTTYVNALRESEGRFRSLSEALPQLVWVTNASGQSEYTSQRWEDYTGMKAGELKEWIAIVHPDDVTTVNAVWTNSLSTGKGYQYDVRLRSKSGEYRWFTLNGSPVRDEENKIVKWVGAFTDVHTERKFSQQLRKQVEERTRELALKNAELEKMNKELESFTYISSHDLQEPLRKIQTFSSRILEKESTGLSETGKDYFRRMQNAAGRMQRLIEDLLAFSRASSGERKFEKSSLNTIVEEVKIELKEAIAEKKAVVEVSELCEAYVIPFQFRQLMQNLIGNALKFTREDVPPHITIDSEKLFLSEAMQKNKSLINLSDSLIKEGKEYCHIRVRDRGIGFEGHFNERIFEVFQRLHGKNEYVGTGIGLAIVKKIVENHGGLITATGEIGKGATFDIYIPISNS